MPIAALACLAACGAPQAEVDVGAYLRVGVDMRTECRSVADALTDGGLEVVARLERPRSCALGAVSADGARSAVRVVTARGIAYAADGRADGLPGGTTVALVAPPGGAVGPEVLVARAPSATEGRCVTVLHVDAQGGAREIGLEPGALAVVAPAEAPTCVTEVLDVDGDGTAEAWVAIRALTLAATATRVPTVRVPLAPGAGVFEYVPPPEAHWQRERAARDVARTQARRDRDFPAAHALAVELALVALLAGEGRAAACAAYDAGLAGWSLVGEPLALAERTRAALAAE